MNERTETNDNEHDERRIFVGDRRKRNERECMYIMEWREGKNTRTTHTYSTRHKAHKTNEQRIYLNKGELCKEL